jgi:hypothetical protein
MPLTFVNASDFPHCSDSPTVGGNNRPESLSSLKVRNSIAVYKNPISCPPLLVHVAALSDSIVQTTKPAKMKQLYMTVAAVLLFFPNFGLTQERFYEVSLPIRANDIVNSPDRLLDMGTAFTFIDEICGQIPEGSPSYVTASGAYNMDTGDFMIWNEYMSTVGLFGNPVFHWAVGPWHTFEGTCSLKPASVWVEHSYRSEGGWVFNRARRPKASRFSPIDIHLPGFSAETSMFSWRSRCEDVDQMAATFRAMPEFTHELRTIWKGLDPGLRKESIHSWMKSIEVPFEHEGQAVATTSVLVVKALLVLNVQRWYWYYEPGMSGVTTGWQGMEGLWDNVYADLAWVEARGLVQQRPVNPLLPDKPDWWYCVNMGPENHIFRPKIRQED